MEPLYELHELVAILKDELRLCDEFENLLRSERRELERFRPAEVEKLAVRKLALRGRFIDLERKRDQSVKKVLARCGARDKGTVTVTRLVEFYPDASGALKPLASSLRGHLQRLAEMNGINEAILQKTLGHLRATSGFLNLSLGENRRREGRLVCRQV